MSLISTTATSAFALSTITAGAFFFPAPAKRNRISTKSDSSFMSSSSSSSSNRGGVGSKSAALEMEFPYLSPTHQELMSDLVSTMESHLGPHLNHSDGALIFQNDSGSSNGVLDIVKGSPGSFVDFVLMSWVNSKLPFGTLNTATVFAFLDSTTTWAPHLLLEFIQNSPTSLVLLMDFLPRKDLVLHSDDYLHRYYEQTNLDQLRQSLSSLPSVKPFVSSSLFIRSLLSPTAVAVTINCEEEGGMELLMRDHVGVAAKEMVKVWLVACANDDNHKAKGAEEKDVEVMIRRDNVIKKKAVEIDLTVNLPKLFGQEVTDQVIAKVHKSFGIV